MSAERIRVAVLASGRHCACAIPMAVRLQDVEAIVQARNRSGKNYMLMETENYSRTFLYARKLHDQGVFGELQLLRGGAAVDIPAFCL